jgi:hypothetical protein
MRVLGFMVVPANGTRAGSASWQAPSRPAQAGTLPRVASGAAGPDVPPGSPGPRSTVNHLTPP